MFDFGLLLAHWVPFLHSSIGIVCFVPVYALWVSLLLPGVWLSMLAGALYGTWLGTLLVFIGALSGAEISFFLGRTYLRRWVRSRLVNFPKLQAIETAVSREGVKLVLLTRLSPAFPFSLLNFVYGLSEVSVRDYTIGLIGILPGTFLFCSLGALAGDLSHFSQILRDQNDLNSLVFRLVGVLATFAVVWLVTRAVRIALQDVESST